MLVCIAVVSHGQSGEEVDPEFFVIYKDGKKGGVWGLEETPYSSFTVSKDQHYMGNSSLHLKWNVAEGDNSLSMIGFDFKSKNLLKYLESMAISFYVRTSGEPTTDIPIVLVLEDGYRDQAQARFNPVGLFGKTITKEWTKALVPLKNFNFLQTGADPTDIQHLILAFESEGDFFIDEIRLELFADPYVGDKTKPLEDKNLLQLPRSLYSDDMPNGWGVSTPYCGNFKLVEEGVHQGSKAIQIQMDSYPDDCDWNEFGFSWTGWEKADLSKVHNMSALQFFLKAESDQTLVEFEVSFHDYLGNVSRLELYRNYLKGHQVTGDWQMVRMPLTAFKFSDNGVDLAQIKQLSFKIGDRTNCLIDEIELVEYRGSIDNPFND